MQRKQLRSHDVETPKAVAEKPKALERVARGKFAPGNSGAPRGATRNSRFITQHLISYLREVVASPEAKTPEQKKIFAERTHWLVVKMVKMALEGDTTCLRMVMERIEGTPTQTINYRDTKDDAVVRENYTEEELRRLPPDEFSKLYATSLLVDGKPS
jgi:hypothetical protein